MTKWRFIYLIFSILLSLTVLIVILFFYDDYLFDLYFGLLFINLIIIFWFRRSERKKMFGLTMIYLNDLEPLKYLEEYEKYNRKRIRTKNNRLMDGITKAQILIDAGKVEESREILEGYIDQEPKFSAFVRFWYYKNWINYFDEVNDPKRMKFLIDQMQSSIENFPPKYRLQMLANLQLIEARYFVREGIFLDTAEGRYTDVLRGNFPRLTMMHCVYQMGVIAYKTGRFDIARSRLESVVKNGNKLNIVSKAQELLHKIPLD